MDPGVLVPGRETLGPQVGMPLSQQLQVAAKDKKRWKLGNHPSPRDANGSARRFGPHGQTKGWPS